jgi:transcriptional regulator with XRE-family HTH domain
MPVFIYRLGMATGQDQDERRAYLKAFGGNLKIQRVKRGLSQEEFADLIGYIAPSTAKSNGDSVASTSWSCRGLRGGWGCGRRTCCPRRSMTPPLHRSNPSQHEAVTDPPAGSGADATLLRRLGLRVKVLRTHRQLSQEELALAAGLDRTYVSRVERGAHNVTVLTTRSVGRSRWKGTWRCLAGGRIRRCTLSMTALPVACLSYEPSHRYLQRPPEDEAERRPPAAAPRRW